MKYSFSCYGHENIIAKHKTTLEFTKDSELSLKGDCIVGVKADFSLLELKKFIKSLKNNNKKITIIIETIENSDNENIVEKINAEINPDFNSDKEIVIRKSDFISERTFAINADKAAFELNKDLVEFLKVKYNKIKIIIEKR
jgi:hypothetical protein|tara:strand:- start:4207 stop:4632 length:426 start_codon:yes stop_codon:yes gene_type:complete